MKTVIKNHDTCNSCYYGGFNDFCQKGECSDCIMNYYLGTDADLLCRCNMIDNGDECRYYIDCEELNNHGT